MQLQVLALALALALTLPACSSSGVQRHRLQDQALSEALAAQLSAPRSLDDQVHLTVEQLRLRPEPGSDRVRADFNVRIDDPFRNGPWLTRWAVDARLHWSASDCTLQLVQVQVDLPPVVSTDDYAVRQREIRLASALARQIEGQSLWSISTGPQGCRGARVRLQSGAVELTLLP